MKFNSFLAGAVITAAAGLASATDAEACSMIAYSGPDSLHIVGRSLDWKTPIPTNLYVYPRGMDKVSSPEPDAIRWTSRYGAIYAVGYDGGVTEGMNEKGLVVNSLFCKGTVYENTDTKGRSPMSLSVFVAWLLDQNATTQEAVDVIRRHEFSISGATFDSGTAPTLHWAITDAGGHTAVVEFDHGTINIFDADSLPVLTNDPVYPKMLAINEYWTKIGGADMLPGTVKSPDRFVRAAYFLRHVEKTGNADLGLSICRSLLMNVSVPYQYEVETEPNVSSTQWRSFANNRDLRYYFDIATNPGMFYVDLGKLQLQPGAPVLKLDTSKSTDWVGCANGHLRQSAPFSPMY